MSWPVRPAAGRTGRAESASQTNLFRWIVSRDRGLHSRVVKVPLAANLIGAA
jgi:hypothetical protein